MVEQGGLMNGPGTAARHWLLSRNDDLIEEQYSSLRPQVPAMYVAVLINILFLGFVSASFTGSAVFGVPVVMSTLIVLRLIVFYLWRWRKISPSVAEMRRSLMVTMWAAVGTALTLSLWCQFILSRPESQHERAYVALFTTLCTISCAASLSTLPLAAYIVVGIGTVPVSVALLRTGDPMLQSMGGNLLLVTPLIVEMIYRQYMQFCGIVASRSAITAEQVKVSELAYRDPLTGLANRRLFLDELKIASGSSGNTSLAVAMIDLDGFKIINDTYGHRTGDALLVETARRCQRLDMGDTLVARFGGDEFAVLLRDVARIEDARLRLESLVAAFTAPFVVGPYTFKMTASIGLAHNAASAGTTVDLVNHADLAMYEAKRASPGAICVFKAELEAQTRRRMMIRQALATHAENDLIGLVYQPVVETATSLIVGFEALARWTHPTLGVISPAEFVPIAEQAGMTEPMTAHLLSMALRTAATWPAGVGLSFNLSAAELGSPNLAQRLLDIAARHDFDPRQLSIEVTETALLKDFEVARTALCKLQAGGVRILLDDFGAGYASIGYLREIRFDGIKLDGSLIGALMESPAAHDLLTGVLHLCEAIGASVTAEMVENAAQHDLLRALGVQNVQGYFLARPLTAVQTLIACSGSSEHVVPEKSSVVMFGHRLRARPAK